MQLPPRMLEPMREAIGAGRLTEWAKLWREAYFAETGASGSSSAVHNPA